MVHSGKPTGRALSMPAGLAIGAAASVATTLAGSAILAYLIHKEYLRVDTLGYGVMVILFLAAAAGSALAVGRIKHLHLQVCLLSAGIFYGILLGIHALFFDSGYTATGITAAVILPGSIVPVIPRIRKGRGMRRLYRKGRVR